MDIKEHVKTLIEIEIVKALNNAPDAIEKLVSAALSKEVDESTGRTENAWGKRVPYLDFLVGDEIRTATRSAVHKVVAEMNSAIEDQVRAKLSAEDFVGEFTKCVLKAATEDWRIRIAFEGDK